MKVFELGTGWEEGYSFWLFTHTNKTQLDFQDDVRILLRKYGSEFLRTIPDEWAGTSDWMEFIAGKLPELGYVEIQTMKCEHATEFIISEDHTLWKDVVGEELFAQALQHNEAIRFRSE